MAPIKTLIGQGWDMAIPAESSRKLALARDIAGELIEGGETLVSVHDPSVWGPDESRFVFQSFLQGITQHKVSGGEVWNLLVGDVETLYGLVGLPLLFSWEFVAVPADGRVKVMSDHDDYLYIVEDPSIKEFATTLKSRYSATS